LLLKESLALNFVDTLLIAGIFFLCEEFISPILYKLHIRNRPY
jgi:CDP-2,3-bis-(O-geranylgeranyl)-sn-glycerol synthase